MPPRIKRVAGALLLFGAGVLFDRMAAPLIYREVVGLSIHSTSPQGCEGGLGVSRLVFGWRWEYIDGVYKYKCDLIYEVADGVWIACACPK